MRRPSAAEHNSVMAAARDFRGRRLGEPRPQHASEDLPGGVLLLHNTGATAVPIYGALRITGTSVSMVPGERPVLAGIYGGAAADHAAVAQEPIAPDAVGRVIVHGVTWAQVTGSGQWASLDAAGRFARSDDGGPVEVLAGGAGGLAIVRVSIHQPEDA